MKNLQLLLVAFLLCATVPAYTQIGIGTSTPNSSAELDVSSTTKGFLPPRMTAAQRIAIDTPAEGLLVFQSDGSKGYYYFVNGVWTLLTEEKYYPTVTISTQQWMEKNLDVTTYRNGDPIPYVTDPTQWASLTTGAWCYYNNDPSNNATYGKLYNWHAVNDPRGLAPAGFHIPTDAEWTTLELFLGGASLAGGLMKVSGTTTWTAPNTGATNTSGFSGLPGGSRLQSGTFSFVRDIGFWWSSTERDIASTAWIRFLDYPASNSTRTFYDLRRGHSVRCLKD